MQSKLLAGTAVSALLALALASTSAAQAGTLVGTIIGAYDQQCSASACITDVGGASAHISNYASNFGGAYDTPSLFILNPNSSAFTNVTITLTGYQDVAGNGGTGASYTSGASNPATITLTLPSIAANTVYQLSWAGGLTTSGAKGLNLWANDYDDILGQRATFGGPNDSAGYHCGSGSGSANGYCSYVGNFDVKFSADLNGNPISSDFGNLAYGTNAFVGWEGLDPDGLSETFFDAHTKTFPGTLAEIFTGTNQNGGGTQVPEPGTLALIAGGLGALATARRRKSKQA